ncbi:ferric reductase like transmembrane component-domain-containing protein [Morchella snyderi]|nr:ferric reductase like transmembrane component-domain-containing protein [Morchella snyderi]
MATVNMIPLFVCMVRNNWIGDAVQVNFDTWNLFHRWIGRIVALESFAHMGAWTVNKIDQSGWSGVGEAYKISPFLQVGLMAEIALALIAVASASPLRHANYEFFLSLHQILVIFFMVGVYWHLVIDQLPQITYANITIAIWVLDRVMRIFWILRWNVKMKGGKVSCNVAEVIPLKGANAVRVSVELVRPWDFKPGQHAYIYIPRIGWWQSHPFSIAWASTEQDPRPASRLHRLSMPPLPVYHRELVTTQAPKTKTTMHFVISKHSGFTKKLYDAAAKANNGNDGEKGEVAPLQVVGMFEGPYGGHHSFDSYGTTIFVAGGVGITHGIGYVKHLLHGYNKGTAATQRIKLVWVVRSVDNIEWVADWLEGILQMPNVRQVVEVDVYITQPNEAAHTSSWSGRGGVVKLYTGRPDFDIIVEKAVKRQVGAMAVNVCGGGAVSDAVRAAARKYVDVSSIDFSEESFSW